MFGILHRTSSYPALDEISPAGLQALHAAWQRACGFRDVPLATDMPINAVMAVLPNMALVGFGQGLGDAHGEPRYLVFGPALRLLLGRDPTGQSVQSSYPRDIAAEALQALARVRQERRPLFFRRDFRVLGRDFGYNRLMLPLRDAANEISHVVLGIYPRQPDLKHASQWQSVVAEMEEKRLGQARTAAEWHTVLAVPDGADDGPSPAGDVWLI